MFGEEMDIRQVVHVFLSILPSLFERLKLFFKSGVDQRELKYLKNHQISGKNEEILCSTCHTTIFLHNFGYPKTQLQALDPSLFLIIVCHINYIHSQNTMNMF